MSEQAVRPFYCGTQMADWRAWNCDNCHQAGDCEIERAIDEAYLGDGTVTPEIGRRMGVIGNEAARNWSCPERADIVPAVEWRRRLAPPPTRIAPLWRRLWRAGRFAAELWVPWWRPEEDIYGVPGRISLQLAWELAWGIHCDEREVVRG